ncbi:MAG TPA: DUF5661 family protein [Thermodesulfovibrionia bacterium]|nr:DUF5661 family protein [Thermodesulfovibrionia bacterium]
MVKFNKSKFRTKQLKIGTKVELEHTKNKDIARKIALVHLKENKDYYRYFTGDKNSKEYLISLKK